MSLITVEEDRIIFDGEDCEEIVYGWIGRDNDFYPEFNKLFEFVEGDHLAGTDFYQGHDVMGIIKRKSDGRLFGYQYWEGHEDIEDLCEPNGEDFGLEAEYNDDYTETLRGPFWVWQPVRTYVITGWEYDVPD